MKGFLGTGATFGAESAVLELYHDRTGDVALIPLTSSSTGIPKSFSQTLLHRGHDSRTSGDGSATAGTLHHPGGGYQHSSAVATLYALETVDARGTDALVGSSAQRRVDLLRLVYRARVVGLRVAVSVSRRTNGRGGCRN